jgi:hypothetical protein
MQQWDNSSMIPTAPHSVANGTLYRYASGHFNGVVYAAAGYNPWSAP